MRKGDDRRDAIMAAAEALFYTHGYERTSVQDIIDALHFSKGGFYHHFESKLALLEAICQQRAQEAALQAELAIAACPGDAAAKLNALFEKASFLKAGSADFIGLLIRVAYCEDGALMREKIKQRQYDLMLPLINQVVAEGMRTEVFFSPHPAQVGEMILRLGIQLTDEIAFLLAKGNGEDDLQAVMEKLELYRYGMERLLEAPFGSIVIFSVEDMASLCRSALESKAKDHR